MERHFPKVKIVETLNESENHSSKSGKSRLRFQGLMQSISRPSRKDLQMNTSDLSDDESVLSESKRLEIKLGANEVQEKRISVFFLVDELLEKMRVEDPGHFNEAMKTDLVEQWFDMVTYKLDEDICYKVFELESKEPTHT